jgi:DNA-binding IclR family transcriptional regulator
MTLSNGPRTLTEVARATGLSKPTAHRLLASLGYESLVLKNRSENVYLLGPGILRLVQEATDGLGSIAVLARPDLEELWEKTGETITLHVRIGLERICIEEIASPSSIRYVATVGSSAPLHVGSAGKVLLAFEEPDELAKTISQMPLTALTDETIIDRAELVSELDRVREQGWASSIGERVPEAGAVSVPVMSNGRVAAALSVLGPASRMTPERQLEIVPQATKAAATLEKVLKAASPIDDSNDD